MSGINMTSNIKQKYASVIPKNSPSEFNLGVLQLKQENINNSIIPSIITLKMNEKKMPSLTFL